MKILHITDLHLNNTDFIASRLEALTNALSKYNFDVCLLTGDLKNWNNQLWKKPLEFVNTLVEKLNISNLIVVPGNHDLVSGNAFNFNRRTRDCTIYQSEKADYIEQAQKQYKTFEEQFIAGIKGIKVVHPGLDHKVISIGEINFVVINSVFAFCAEEKNNTRSCPFCFNCKALSALLNVGEISKTNSVAVSHVPFDDIDSCFNVYDYDDEHLCKKQLESKLFCCFAGHEHTKNNEFYKVVGAKHFLDSKFNCAIYDMDTDGGKITSIKTSVVFYDNRQHRSNNFTIGLDNKALQEIYEASKNNLKPQLFGLNIKENDEDIIKNSAIDKNILKINGFEYSRHCLDTVFSAVCEMNTLNGGRVVATNRFNNSSAVCDEIIKIMDNSEFNLEAHNKHNKLFIPVTIKGRLGAGKSTFLNVLYWEMLLRQRKSFEYIPIMINFADMSAKQLGELIGNIKSFSATYGKSVYVLIDGLDNCQIYNNENAENLWRQIESLKGIDCKFMLCINQHYKSFLEKNANHRDVFQFINNNKTSKYLLYLRPISYVDKVFHYQKCRNGLFCKKDSIQAKTDQFFKNYILSYFSLSQYSDKSKEEALYEFIKTNETLNIDFNLLHSFRINLIDRSKKNYDNICSLYFSSRDEESLQCAAVTYMTTNKCMLESEFSLLKSHNIINFAFAKNLIAQLKIYKNIYNSIIFQSKTNTTISQTSVLPRSYFNTELNGFLKICIEGINNKEEIQKNIVKAITTAINDKRQLHYIAIAQLIYILRYTDVDPHELENLVKAIKKSINIKNEKNPSNYAKDNYLIALRTLQITEIYHKKISVYEYLQDLIENKKKLEINRQFSLFYYGDRDSLNIASNEYYKTFSRLYYRINKHLVDDGYGENYLGYIEFDLFTICNIVQVNAQKIIYSTDDPRKTYLYNTIAMLYDLLKVYCKNAKVSKENLRTYYYFYSLKNDFGHLLIRYYDAERKAGKPISETLIKNHIESDDKIGFLRDLISIPFNNKAWIDMLIKMDGITSELRSGWKDRITLNNVRHESVAEHTFSSMLISWFISDAHSKLREKLLVLLFLHDLAEAYYGDVAIGDKEHYSITQDRVIATTLAFVYLCTYDGYPNWFNYADSIIGYVFPQNQQLISNDNSATAKIVKIIDRLQLGIKLIEYSDNITITHERFAEFYKEIKDLDVAIDSSLTALKNDIIAKLDNMKNQIESM